MDLTMHTLRRAVLALCAIAITTGAAGAQTVLKPPGRGPNYITLEEIQAASATDAYDLVRSLRPQWLKSADHQTIRTKPVVTAGMNGMPVANTVIDEPEIVVYLDNIRYGTPESLRELAVEQMFSLEFVTPAKATMRWGGGHLHGAIAIRSHPD
jgi:hypothetical protein